MNTVERIKSICKERGIKISKLERDLGFGNAYISGLKKGSVPDDRLKLISEYLNLSVDYLITGVEPDAVENVVAEHIELITTFDKLAKEQQESIMNMMKLFIKENNK